LSSAFWLKAAILSRRASLAASDPKRNFSFCQTVLSNKQLSAFKRQADTFVANIGQSEAIHSPLEPMGGIPPAGIEQVYYD